MSHRFRILNLILQYPSPPPPSQPWHSQPKPPPPAQPAQPAQPPPPAESPPEYYRPQPIIKGLCARFGFILLIIAIVGIIIFYTVPWFSINAKFSADDDNGDEHEYMGHYGQDFEWMYGDKEFEDRYGDEYLDNADDYQDFLGDTIGLAIIGLIFILIIAIIAQIIGWLPRFHERWPKLSRAIDATFGVITLLPTLMILFCSMRFLGRDLEFAHDVAIDEYLGYEVSGWVIYPAAYVLLIIGIIILFLAISIIRQGMEGMIIEDQRRARHALPTTPPARPRTPHIRQHY